MRRVPGQLLGTSGSFMSAKPISTIMSVTRGGQEYHDQTVRGWRKIIDKRISTHRQSHPRHLTACLAGTSRWMSSPTTWLGNKSSACSPLVRKTVSMGPMSSSQSEAGTEPRKANERPDSGIMSVLWIFPLTRDTWRWHAVTCGDVSVVPGPGDSLSSDYQHRCICK